MDFEQHLLHTDPPMHSPPLLQWAWTGHGDEDSAERERQLVQLKQRMEEADTFNEWQDASSQYDRVSGRSLWRLEPQCGYYDYRLIALRVSKLREARVTGDVPSMIFLLRAGVCVCLCVRSRLSMRVWVWVGGGRIRTADVHAVSGACRAQVCVSAVSSASCAQTCACPSE